MPWFAVWDYGNIPSYETSNSSQYEITEHITNVSHYISNCRENCRTSLKMKTHSNETDA